MKATLEKLLSVAQLLNTRYPISHLPGYRETLDPNYHAQLLERWDAAQSWSLVNKPRITALGDIHPDITNLPSVQEREKWVWDNLEPHLGEPSVVTIETPGATRTITNDAWRKIMRGRLKKVYGKISDRDLRRYLVSTNDAISRLLKNDSAIVIFGEEHYPMLFDISVHDEIDRTGFRSQKTALVGSPQEIFARVDVASIRLRSAIMFLRTIERLKLEGRINGVILQGKFHVVDTQQFTTRFNCLYQQHVMSEPRRVT